VKRLVMTGLRKLGGFGTSTLVTGVVALFAIPVVVSFAGPMVWGGIAVAQSIAGMAAVLVAFGWSVMGPVRIDLSPYKERGQLYADSLFVRLFLFILLLPPTAYLIASSGFLATNFSAPTGLCSKKSETAGSRRPVT
jgi:hypothetical protein